MKNILGMFFIISFASCGNKKSEIKNELATDSIESTADTSSSQIPWVKVNTDSRAIDTIMSLPEIIDLGKDIEKKSNGKNHLTAMSMYTPIELETGCYHVTVYEDIGVRLAGIYNFNVYVPEMKIMFDDPISGNELTLDEWRK
jgi:hypothetical protein